MVEAGVVPGRKLTSYPSIRTDLRNAGADVVDEEEYAPGDGARPDVSDERREDMDAPGTFAAKGGDIPHEAARSAMKDVGSTKRSVVANHRASVRSKRTASLVEQGVPLVAEDGGDE